MGPVMTVPLSYKVTSQTIKTCYLYSHTDLIMPVGKRKRKKKKRRNKVRVHVNHRGNDKALKLKQIYSQSSMEINNILLTERPPREIGEA